MNAFLSTTNNRQLLMPFVWMMANVKMTLFSVAILSVVILQVLQHSENGLSIPGRYVCNVCVCASKCN